MTLPIPESISIDASPEIAITPTAVDMAKKKLEEAAEPVYGLRVGIRGGGCAGFSYVFDFATKIRPDRDRVYDFDGLRVVVDAKSLDLLRGATLDWETKLMGYGFKWLNPNAKSDCGCGTSFMTS
jgi:iron-sulfur cluster assembly protein